MQQALIASILLSSAGCQKKTDTTPLDSHPERYLRISFTSDVRSLDPRIGIDYPSMFAVKMLFEGLMCIGPDGKVRPAIAESYDLSPDQKTYTFHLRQSTWSDGSPLTAYDFEYTWKCAIGPKTKAVGVHNFYSIKNVQEIIKGTLPLESAGFKAVDDHTLVVQLEHPTPYFLEILATAPLFAVNRLVDQKNSNWVNEEEDQFVCNGPFILEAYQLENQIIVKKNPRYWNAQAVKLPGIKISIIKEPMTQLNLYEQDELDWFGKPLAKIPLEALASLKKEHNLSFFPQLGLYWYFLNTQTYPFHNKKMRQAFAYAINRKTITEHVLQAQEKPALGVLPYSLSQQEEPYFQDNNTELALKLFSEALLELGITEDELPEITVNVADSPVHLKVVQALQEQWYRVLGVNVKIEHQDWKAHFAKLQNGDYQIGGMEWTSWLRDPMYILQTFRYRDDGINMCRFEDPKFKALLDASEEELDPVRRCALFHEAEKILMDEFPIIPVYFCTMGYTKKECLKDVYVSELAEVDFRWSQLE